MSSSYGLQFEGLAQLNLTVLCLQGAPYCDRVYVAVQWTHAGQPPLPTLYSTSQLMMSVMQCCSRCVWSYLNTFTCVIIIQLSKIAVKSCEVYTYCESCVTTLDPLRCGWCDDRCTTEAQCPADWSNRRCPPIIYSVRNHNIVLSSDHKYDVTV